MAKTDEQKSLLTTFLEAKSIKKDGREIEHKLNKSQRYRIIKKIFANKSVNLEEKETLLQAEMQIDYSDVDELQKIACQACIPDLANKEKLWE